MAGAALSVSGLGAHPAASQESVIHTFDASELNPAAPLITAPGGVLYGTTSGDEANPGSVFRLIPPAAGKTAWTETVLTRFSGGGFSPYGSMLLGPNGVLYGTTYAGGPVVQSPAAGRGGGIVIHDLPITYGTIFTLTPPNRGKTHWTETVLHDFAGPPGDGAQPWGGLIEDASGTLYGTTYDGGAGNNGTVFSLTRPTPGQPQWRETVLHSFLYTEGAGPMGALLRGADGALYGTAAYGGPHCCNGSIYRLSPPTAPRTEWTLTILHAFNGSNDGGTPMGALAADRSGALYGTQPGAVFKLTPPSVNGGAWAYQTLLAGDGEVAPGVTVSSDGTIYGAVQNGAGVNGSGVNGSGIPCGALFTLKPPPPGKLAYQKIVLHDFDKSPGDACQTAAAPIFSHDPSGAVALYGLGYNAVFRFSYADWR